MGKQPERYKLVAPGTVFYNPMRILLGSIAMVDDGEEPGITSPDYVVFRPKPGVLHHRWLYYWLRSPDGAALIKSLTRGAVRERLLFRRLAPGEIDPPPYAAQFRFAEAVQHVSRARAAAEARLEAAEALYARRVSEMFASKEARGWDFQELSRLLSSPGQYGLSHEMNSDPSGVPVLRMGNLSPGKIDWTQLRYVNLPDGETAKYLLKKGDLLFNRTNSAELVGKSAVFGGEREALFASYLIRFRLNREAADANFVCSYINAEGGRRFIRENMGRAIGQVNISASVMSRMPVPAPPVVRQKELVAELAHFQDVADQLVDATKQERAAVAALPAALLRQAFRGEL